MKNLQTAAENVRRAIMEVSHGLVERETLVELVVLAAVTQEHLLVIGPPGTGKSEAVRRIARCFGGRYFEYLIGRFTEPTEIFGPVNLNKLREGVVETETTGMLPEADIAFLDEVFLGSTAILNTLLGILNERRFRRGHTSMRCPLRVCVGASNHLPSDAQLAAFADRFLLYAFIQPIADSGLEELLASGWWIGGRTEQSLSSMDDLDVLTATAQAMDLSRLRSSIAHGIRLLRSAGIGLSDRRVVKIQQLIAAAGALAGREQATESDLWPMIFALPSEPNQELGRDVLREFLTTSENGTLVAAPAEGSLGSRARAARILRSAAGILADVPEDESGRASWRLRIEAIAREIDSSFTSENMPSELAALRTNIVEALAAGRRAAS